MKYPRKKHNRSPNELCYTKWIYLNLTLLFLTSSVLSYSFFFGYLVTYLIIFTTILFQKTNSYKDIKKKDIEKCEKLIRL